MLARSGIEAMALGQRDATDCLSIVLSMVDSNSHYYGPLSMETFDTLMRLDKALGEFLEFLDQTLGRDMPMSWRSHPTMASLRYRNTGSNWAYPGAESETSK